MILTLGLSPDSKMVVLHDFTPCVDDELEVKRGQVVNILYRENDWVYVIGQDSRQEGFIPTSYCAPYNSQLAADLSTTKKKLPREQGVSEQLNNENMPLLPDSKIEHMDELNMVHSTNNAAATSLKNSAASLHALLIEPEVLPFHKEPCGRYIVLYTFIARDENDVSVERGEFVTLLNREDPDWFWIVRSDGQEGFIPAAFVYPAESVLQTQQKLLNACAGLESHAAASNGLGLSHSNKQLNKEQNGKLGGNLNSLGKAITTGSGLIDTAGCINALQPQQQQQQLQQNPQQIGIGTEDFYHGTELVMLYDYKVGCLNLCFFT